MRYYLVNLDKEHIYGFVDASNPAIAEKLLEQNDFAVNGNSSLMELPPPNFKSSAKDGEIKNAITKERISIKLARLGY